MTFSFSIQTNGMRILIKNVTYSLLGVLLENIRKQSVLNVNFTNNIVPYDEVLLIERLNP